MQKLGLTISFGAFVLIALATAIPVKNIKAFCLLPTLNSFKV
ncbi:hypothetical protein GXM_07662 [Nostoc sphaeroides CCNUC1]|uniref:Uncharacterized protein n=1 Tax=Nostoc sphaeroides CCNUC1 TaxID=2653204 RepID=A0A5P8WBK4_9NOSO|nr:hypothetical protein GXM_07662 [Nostoc sphaeroides CCNUC1]